MNSTGYRQIPVDSYRFGTIMIRSLRFELYHIAVSPAFTAEIGQKKYRQADKTAAVGVAHNLKIL